MLDILAQFDAFGLAAVAASLLFLAGLIRVLVDNRSFEEVSRRHQKPVDPRARPTPQLALSPEPPPVGETAGGDTAGADSTAPGPWTWPEPCRTLPAILATGLITARLERPATEADGAAVPLAAAGGAVVPVATLEPVREAS